MTCRLFLHSPSESPDAREMAGRMPEIECLGERALLLARPGDVVCVASEIDERYLDVLEALELGPRRGDVVAIGGVVPGTGISARLVRDPCAMDRVVGRLDASAGLVVCPFFATPDAEAVARALEQRLSRPVGVEGGPPRLARRLHDKLVARALANSLGIPVAPGEVVRVGSGGRGLRPSLAALREAAERWSGATGRVIVRGASGASGSSTFTARAGDLEEMVEEIRERTDNAAYLVEPLFEARASPNVEVVVAAGSPIRQRVGVTDQVLDAGLAYSGSTHPSRATLASRMVADSLAIAGWMRARGYSGRVGFDFVEHESGSGRHHFLTEINPRINGASYPLALLRRLVRLADRRATPRPAAFRTRFVRVPTGDFGELARLTRPLLYDPGRGDGVVYHSPGALSHGKIGVACIAATPAAATDLGERVEELAGDRAPAPTSLAVP